MNPQSPNPLQPVSDPTQPAVPVVATSQVPEQPTVPIAQQPQAVPAAAPVPVHDAPTVAEDVDVIEPEWIGKAQQIIAQTAHDPFEQANQLNALKSDYLMKRYAKEVKVATD